jgi:hypothetical protein
VLDVVQSHAAVIACMDAGPVLDGFPDRAGCFRARTAEDELLLIGPARMAAVLLAEAGAHVERAGSWGLAVDVTDAWTMCTITGDAAHVVWARLSANPVPDRRPALVQGAVASIPAKSIICDGCIHVMTAASVGHHLPHRILHTCRDLVPQTYDAAPFSLGESGMQILRPTPAAAIGAMR